MWTKLNKISIIRFQNIKSYLCLSEELAIDLIVVTTAVEAMGTYLVLGQSYRLDEVFQSCELEGGEAQSAGYEYLSRLALSSPSKSRMI